MTSKPKRSWCWIWCLFKTARFYAFLVS